MRHWGHFRRLAVKSDFASHERRHSLRPRLPKGPGRRSSVVERIIGNAEVGSSILPGGTTFPLAVKINVTGDTRERTRRPLTDPKGSLLHRKRPTRGVMLHTRVMIYLRSGKYKNVAALVSRETST